MTIKVTEDCNSNCRYCYSGKSRAGMSQEVLEALYTRINEYLFDNPEETVEILWHGGEPLLAGPSFFREALALERKHCVRTGSRIRYSIQSNLTLLTEEIVDLLGEMDIRSVGTSFDPQPGIRGPGKEIDSDQYNRSFFRGLGLLERSGLTFGINYVVTQKSLAHPLDVFYFLTNLSPAGTVFLNPVLILGGKGQDLAVSPSEHLQFLGTIFPHWWKNRGRYPGVQPFAALTERILGKKTEPGCMDFGTCNSSSRHIELTPEGEALQSGYAGELEMPRYGNIREMAIAKILQNERKEEFVRTVQELRNSSCADCRFWDLCHESLPQPTLPRDATLMFRTQWCETRIRFIEDVFEPVTGVRFEPKGH